MHYVKSITLTMTSVKGDGVNPPDKLAAGSQTLARGLSALQAVATSPNGLTVQQVADFVGVPVVLIGVGPGREQVIWVGDQETPALKAA